MKLQVTQENLAKALNIVSKIANIKTQMPILDNVLLKTDGNRLLIASTNLEIASTQYIGAKISQAGTITIPARIITDFVNNLPADIIDLTVEGNQLKIVSGKFSSVINGADAEEFPDLPIIDEESATKITLSANLFKEAINQTIIATSSDIARPVLMGVLWRVIDGDLFFVATDGYRLSERKVTKTDYDLDIIIPTQTLQEVLRAMTDQDEEVEILIADNQIRFRVNETEIISQLIEGTFPDYKRLIPDNNSVELNLAKSDFSKAVKIASYFTQHSSNGVTMTIDDDKQTVFLKSIASEIGENISELEAEIKGNGQITLNSKYLNDCLNIIHDDQIQMEFNGKLAPCVIKSIKDSDFIHIIMPLKS